MPFLGQLLHMGQAVELCNVIESCGLYPSLSGRGRDYTSETFRTSFNHFKGGNKNGINKVTFGETMKRLENCKKNELCRVHQEDHNSIEQAFPSIQPK